MILNSRKNVYVQEPNMYCERIEGSQMHILHDLI
uniref:Uncharacterized protein n=1 Tax=Anguilla anguilla TaxID=7936 RepID=A0A0E9U4Q0_ANGAN